MIFTQSKNNEFDEKILRNSDFDSEKLIQYSF